MTNINAQSMIMQSIPRFSLSSAAIWLSASLLVGVMLIMPIFAEAQDEELAKEGTRWVLLVGIADYPSSDLFEIQKLKAPVKDVGALAAFLGDPETGGFDPEHVFTLTDAEATRRNILITFNEITNRVGPEDMVIFYFSGHGMRLSDTGTTYLIPYDHDLRDVATTCIDFADLAEKIRRMEASKVVVILDACHSGGVKQEGARDSGSTGLVKRYMEEFKASEGRALLLSSDESEVSWETEDNGIFTRFLLEGLQGKADANDDGIVTFTEAAAYVEDTVPRYTRANFSRTQKPTRRYEFGQVRGDIPLAINWGKVSRQRQQKLLDDRNATIFQSGLEEDLEEFSLKVTQNVYDRSIKGEDLAEQDSKLVSQVDKLKDGTITPAEYTARARAIYSLTLAELRIAVTPPDAMVTLASVDAPDHVIAPSSPNVYQVKQGSYLLSTERDGYAPDSRQLSLEQVSEELTIQLERLMGTLKLQVEPRDAEVTVMPVSVPAPDKDVQSRAIIVKPSSGTDVRKLPVGTYNVTVKKDGYGPPATELVEIKPDAPTPVAISLNRAELPKPELASITASSLPNGTRVFVDGATAALPYEVAPGMHRIRLERDGYKSYEVSKDLSPSQSVALSPQWILKTGRLQLDVDPPDAKVKVVPINVAAPSAELEGSKAIRIQIKEGKELPIGTYRVEAEKEGYEAAFKDYVVIEMDASVQVTLVLKPLETSVSPIVPERTIIPSKPTAAPGGVPRAGLVAASLVIPGLGQHLNGYSQRGFAYEAVTVATGAVALWALISYNGKLEDYKDAKSLLEAESSNQTELTAGLRDLITKQNDAHDKAESARSLANATQIAFAVVWGISALDAGFVMPIEKRSGFALEAYPTSDGGRIVVSTSF